VLATMLALTTCRRGSTTSNVVSEPEPDSVAHGVIRHFEIEAARLVAAGERHTCAVDGVRTIACWGAHESLQAVGVFDRFDLPERVIQLWGVDDTTCAELVNGALWCWGEIGDSRCRVRHPAGDGTGGIAACVGPSYGAAKLITPDLMSGFAATHGICYSTADRPISRIPPPPTWEGEPPNGLESTVDGDASVPCMDSTKIQRLVRDGDSGPRRVLVAEFPADAGSGHEQRWCGFDGARGVVCTNAQGEARAGGTLPKAPQILVAGRSHVCAATTDEVWCWGGNEAGQCGAGLPIVVRSPSRVQHLRGPVVDLAAGEQHTCAIDGDGVVCWGPQKALEHDHSRADPRPANRRSRIKIH
jgi:hypothetical protein